MDVTTDPGTPLLSITALVGEREPAVAVLQVQACGDLDDGEGPPAILLLSRSSIWEAWYHLSIEMIKRYALRELPAGEIQRVEEHIAACQDCEDRLQDEVELPVAMRSSSGGGCQEDHGVRKERKQRNGGVRTA